RRALPRRRNHGLPLIEESDDDEERKTHGAGASRRDSAGRFHEAARAFREQAGAGTACARDADWRDRARAPADYRGDGPTVGTVLQNECGVLAEPAELLRPGMRAACR